MDKVTWQEFAADLKAKYPEYKDIPDTQFVDAVLTKHPEWKSKVYGANVTEQQRAQLSVPPAIPKPRGFDVHPVRYGIGVTPEQEAGETERKQARREAEHQVNARKGFPGRMANRFSSQGEALEDTITGLVKMGEPGTAEYRQMVDYLRYPRRTQEAREHPIVNAAEGITQGIPVIGMAKDWLKDPANLAADALLGYTMGAAEAPGEFKPPQNRYPTGTGIKAGPLRGSYTRSGLTMDMLDALAKDKPIPHEGYKVVQKGLSLEKYGWKAPEWMHKYAEMVESGLKGGKETPIPGRPGDFTDPHPTLNPLTYEHARNFEVAAGEKIDWSDPGGRMNALQKQARKAIGQDISAGLKPYGWDRPYLQAKADFTRAYGAETKWPWFGKWGGRLGGYLGGGAVGHPFVLGYAGGSAGESIAGQLVRSITRAGARGAETPGEIGSRYIRSQTAPPSSVEEILRSPADRPPASPGAGVNMVPPESRASAEALRVAQENIAKKVSTRGAAKQAMEQGGAGVTKLTPTDIETPSRGVEGRDRLTPDQLDSGAWSLFGKENFRDLTKAQQDIVVRGMSKVSVGESIAAPVAETPEQQAINDEKARQLKINYTPEQLAEYKKKWGIK
jgi:hypothetical protein